MKQKLIKLKGEIYKPTILGVENLTDIYRPLHSATQNTHFLKHPRNIQQCRPCPRLQNRTQDI